MRKFLGLAVLSLLTACAGNVPKPIADAPPNSPTFSEARANPQRFAGSPVRWGGTIASVENLRDGTLIQVVARELGSRGRPQTDDRSQGRFIARFDEFIDPMVFKEGRALTVAGTLRGTEVSPVGEYPYVFPVVDVSDAFLWPEPSPDRAYYRDPFWYDPWYDPWYPYYPYRLSPWYR